MSIRKRIDVFGRNGAAFIHDTVFHRQITLERHHDMADCIRISIVGDHQDDRVQQHNLSEQAFLEAVRIYTKSDSPEGTGDA